MLTFSPRCFQFLTVLLSLFVLGCGGDDEQPLGANENQANQEDSGYRLRIGLYQESDGIATTSVSTAEPGEIVAKFTHFATAQVSAVVTFETTLGVLSPSLGTALTDANGEARIRLLPGTIEGAGTIIASVAIPNSIRTLEVELNFSVTDADTTPQEDVDIALSLTSGVGVPNTIRVDAPGTLTATVLNQAGTPLSNSIITFTSELLSFDPLSGSALTDANGMSSIIVNAGNNTGVATITASVTVGDETYQETLNVTVNPPSVKLGSGSGASFIQGALNLSVNPLSAGGTTGVTVNVVDENNDPYTAPLSISFSSPCVVQTQASIDANVTTVNGSATATYRASGCVGADRITASLNFGGVQFTASADLTIANDDVGSIVFVDASPSTIVLSGAGGQGLVETSTVIFQVLGSQSLPVANQQVNFSLTTSVGGITFNPASATTDSNGYVSTQVQSGSISTSVVVIATLNAANISTQSGLLVISTGVPDQDSITIALSPLNPEAWEYNGETVTVTAYAADQFNNPVPDGVSLSFTAEGGIVEPSCTTVNGSCTVTWTSQNPRPDNGIVSIMVSATGGESFSDENGNGVFDDGDILHDLTEAYLDSNWDGVRNAGEPYVDFNVNGMFDAEDGLYGGPTCSHTSLCAPVSGATVFDQAQLVMSSSFSNISFDRNNGDAYAEGSPIIITIADSLGNAMPVGTTIAVESNNGSLSESSFIIRERLTARNIQIRLSELNEDENNGFITVIVTSPKGQESSNSVSFTY